MLKYRKTERIRQETNCKQSDNRKTDEIRQEEERQERKEQEEQERRKLLANPEYAATYAQLMAMETAEKEKKRAEMLTRARLETI